MNIISRIGPLFTEQYAVRQIAAATKKATRQIGLRLRNFRSYITTGIAR